MGSKESTALLRTPFDVGLQPGAMGFTQQSSDDAIPHVVTASNLIYNHRLPLEKREGRREGGREGGREISPIVHVIGCWFQGGFHGGGGSSSWTEGN